MTPILEVGNLRASYGVSQVLFDVSFSIAEGEVATLLGRNGMGKTTTVRAIMGLVANRGGTIRFRGQALEGMAPHRIAQLGIALVPEGRQVFPNLTIEENLTAFGAQRNGSADPWVLDKVYAFFPRLKQRARNLGIELSGGEQQMLAIGRALMTNPRLLIMDEATEGLAPLIREDIWRCLARLRERGQTILVIDKYVQRLIELADHHAIIERGRTAWHGSSQELGARPELWHRYLGV